MEIYFDHLGTRCKADIIYNFREVQDHILIVLKDDLASLLLFQLQGNVWVSNCKLQELYSETYVNLQKVITEVFKKDEILNDLGLQADLS